MSRSDKGPAPVPRPGKRQAGARGWAFLLVVALAGVLYGHRLDAVRAPVWDESYYLTAEARLHLGRVQFASHPPLGIMLIAAGDAASGLNDGIDWGVLARDKSVAGEAVPVGFDWRGHRLAAALCGALAAGLFYLLICGIVGSSGAALMVCALFLCDTALIVQFSTAQLDAFQIVFVLAALLCAQRGFASEGTRQRIWATGFGAALMLAAMVRLNALMLAPAGLWLLAGRGPGAVTQPGFWGMRREYEALRRGLLIAAMALGAVLAAAWVLAAMLALSPHGPDLASAAGRVDAGFVSRDYAAGHVLPALGAYARDYARFIAADLAGVPLLDPNASHPWHWLVGSGATTYRWDAWGERVAVLGFVPNRAAWLISLAGVAATLLQALCTRGRALLREPMTVLLLTGWLLNMAALLWLDQGRAMYAYHYLIPLILGHALAASAWRRAGCSERLAWPALALVLGWCLATLPLATHRGVSQDYCRRFLPSCGEAISRTS